MKIGKRPTVNAPLLAVLPVLAYFLAGPSTDAKELPRRGFRHNGSTVYFQQHPQHSPADDWYAPVRSPGWHDEAGN
jgi:hypothetical protein